MSASGNLRDDAREALMQLVLRGDHGPANFKFVGDDGRCRFVARGFQRQYVHGGGSETVSRNELFVSTGRADQQVP
jgi:hypothetical protein